MMKAIIRTKAGKEFSTMSVMDVSNPAPGKGELKVKMVSSRINPVDMDLMKGFPTLKYKNPQIGGIDGAGEVIEIGQEVKDFRKGDKVVFYRMFSDIGSWAEEITVRAVDCARVPDSLDIKEAGAIALPLLTAYDSLLQLNPKKGEKILIHGVGGGVGFQALLLAKKLGLYVTGTAGESDRSLLEKAGLDQFIDYRKEDFSTVINPHQVDYIFDVLGGEVLKKSIDLQPRAIVSVKYIDPSKMYKAGVQMPGILKWIMKLTMKSIDKAARKKNVKIIGQVTGANGKIMQGAINLIHEVFIPRKYTIKTLSEIEATGLTKNDVGKVILF